MLIRFSSLEEMTIKANFGYRISGSSREIECECESESF